MRRVCSATALCIVILALNAATAAGAATLTVAPASLPDGLIGEQYSAQLSATGGTPDVTFSIVSGSLPEGLELDPDTGLIAGAPVIATSYGFTIYAVDSAGNYGLRRYLVVIGNPPLTLGPPMLPDPLLGVPYGVVFQATGGTQGDYVYSFAGALPEGLELDQYGGGLSGTPTQLGPASFTIRVTDADGSSVARAYSVTVRESAPLNQTRPRVLGEPAVGHALSADPGTWAPAATSYRYQWKRCADACAPIAAATGETYVPVAADRGSRLRFEVFADGQYGTGSARSPLTVGVDAPGSVERPTVSGTPDVGAKLTATRGRWSRRPTSYAYQWRRCAVRCVDIAGATALRYRPVAADRGQRLRFRVAATNAWGTRARHSAPTGGVDVPAPLTPPTISGTPAVGEWLTIVPGTWTNSPHLLQHQWQSCDGAGRSCFDIPGAGFGDPYAVGEYDVGRRIRVFEVAYNSAGLATSVSPPTEPVEPAR